MPVRAPQARASRFISSAARPSSRPAPSRPPSNAARRGLPLAGVEGLEPPTPGFGDRCSSQLSYTPRVRRRPDATVPDNASRRRVQEEMRKEAAQAASACPLSHSPSPVCPGLTGAPDAVHVALDCRIRPGKNEKRGVRLSAAHSMILETTPAPTVRPPSRMAKRSFSSMAIGTISVTSISTLSPGITISVPSGSDTTPVTSVVRK